MDLEIKFVVSFKGFGGERDWIWKWSL